MACMDRFLRADFAVPPALCVLQLGKSFVNALVPDPLPMPPELGVQAEVVLAGWMVGRGGGGRWDN